MGELDNLVPELPPPPQAESKAIDIRLTETFTRRIRESISAEVVRLIVDELIFCT